MEELKDFVERLRADIEARCDCVVRKSDKAFTDGGYHLRNRGEPRKGVFAYIRRVKRGKVVPNRCFPIQVERKYAIKAGVDNFAKDPDNNGFHRRPATYYYVIEGNIKSYDQAVEALSRICQVR